MRHNLSYKRKNLLRIVYTEKVEFLTLKTSGGTGKQGYQILIAFHSYFFGIEITRSKRWLEGAEIAYGERVKELINDFRLSKISFLQYQARTYRAIDETIQSLADKKGIQLSDWHLKHYRNILLSDWIYHDPIMIELMPGTNWQDTHYAKLQLIGENLSKTF